MILCNNKTFLSSTFLLQVLTLEKSKKVSLLLTIYSSSTKLSNSSIRSLERTSEKIFHFDLRYQLISGYVLLVCH